MSDKNISCVALETVCLDGYTRTNIMLRPGPEPGGSIDFSSDNGDHLFRLNVFVYPNGHVIVDVIDNEKQFGQVEGIGWVNGTPNRAKSDGLISVDMR